MDSERRFLSWNPFDPNVLSVIDPNSSLGRDLAISLQASAMEENPDSENRGPLPLTDEQIQSITEKLPHLTESDLESLGHRDSSCTICMNTFLASLAEEDIAMVMESPAQPAELFGVTRLVDTCGHLFCRKELSVPIHLTPSVSQLNIVITGLMLSLLTWIRGRNSSCPLCRARLIDPSVERAAVNAARNRIIAAYRLESRILRGDAMRSTDMWY